MNLLKTKSSIGAKSEEERKGNNRPTSEAEISVDEQSFQSAQADGANFSGLGLMPEIVRAVEEDGYKFPTPIQAQAIPFVLASRDLLGCAQTGTGKTAAFSLPILQLLQENKRKLPGIRTLILTPTRELALQIFESLRNYGRHLPVKTTVVFGGVGIEPQKSALRSRPDILVATPGRLLDLMNQGFVDLAGLGIFVLDEADRMLDMGFIHDVRRVISALPKTRQNLLFSATMPPVIQDLAMNLLKNPAKVAVTPIASTSELIDQRVFHVDRANKRALLLHLIEKEQMSKTLVFTRTKAGANRVTEFLVKSSISAEAIHGNKSQSARQRALENFRIGKTKVLVASDLAARGIDVDGISHVVNFDLPDVAETYVHRIGRTGRAAATGSAIAFCEADDRSNLFGIERLIQKKIAAVADHPFAVAVESISAGTQGNLVSSGRRHSSQGALRTDASGSNSRSSGFKKRRRRPSQRAAQS